MPEPRPRRRTFAWILGLATLLVGGVALRGPALESWYLWRLESPTADVRIAAAEALARAGTKRSVHAMLHRLLTEESAEVTEAMGEAIQIMGSDALPALLDALTTGDETTRSIAIEMLQRIEDLSPKAACALAGVITDVEATPHLQADAIHAVGSLGAPLSCVVDALIRVIQKPGGWNTEEAAQALSEIGPGASRATSALVQLLKKGRPNFERWNAADALGNVNPDPWLAVPALLEGLSDKDRHVRGRVELALKKLASEWKVREELRTIANEEKNPLSREARKILREHESSEPEPDTDPDPEPDTDRSFPTR